MNESNEKKLIVARVDKVVKTGLMRVYSDKNYELMFEDSDNAIIIKSISHRPALMILDLALSSGHGFELLQSLRSYGEDMASIVQTASFPIIAISDQQDRDTVAMEAKRLGVAAFLVKPFAMDKLRDVSRQLLSSAHRNQHGGIKTVLVVESEPRVHRLYASIFSGSHKILIKGSEDVTSALQQVELSHYDLVITEQNLVDMSGLELLESLRELGRDIPVMFVTSCKDKDVIDKAKSLGVTDYITKPFTVEALKDRIEAALGLSAVAEEDVKQLANAEHQ